MADSRGNARECLKRAQELRQTGDAGKLYYAALEIRFGIEARLCEYLTAPGDSICLRQIPWRIPSLKKSVDRLHGEVERPIAVTFYDPATHSSVICEYTPVTEKLKKVGERLGNYLHYSPQRRKDPTRMEGGLGALIDLGIQELAIATRGTFLRPPDGRGRANSLRLVWEQGAMPDFVRTNASGLLKLKFQLVSKSGTKAVLRIC
jgi:hypothetical protein